MCQQRSQWLPLTLFKPGITNDDDDDDDDYDDDDRNHVEPIREQYL